MPAGLSRQEFVLSLCVAFSSAVAGSCVMHRILRPDMKEPDVLEHVRSQRAAIRAVQEEVSKGLQRETAARAEGLSSGTST
ncbi:hypothetical protein CSUI_001429 [Cystoisospora suis]|uniref:Transmembrane protein n=1 Tax=Cystoisospora suis TaxID=483139 RepID=A0A2C6KXK0_9APIC|nr:hypothetical protein CSUI_001429 [Cystoisospora suis]